MSKEYIDFVASRFKDGTSTVQDISSAPAAHSQILHAAIGMMGEWVEILFAKDQANLKEELGDFWFYFTALKENQGIDLNSPRGTASIGMLDIQSNMLYELGTLLDTAKKLCIYNKEMNQFTQFLLTGLVLSIHDHFKKYVETYGFTIEELECSNMEKLTKRYPTGYTNQAAQERADKSD